MSIEIIYVHVHIHVIYSYRIRVIRVRKRLIWMIWMVWRMLIRILMLFSILFLLIIRRLWWILRETSLWSIHFKQTPRTLFFIKFHFQRFYKIDLETSILIYRNIIYRTLTFRTIKRSSTQIYSLHTLNQLLRSIHYYP